MFFITGVNKSPEEKVNLQSLLAKIMIVLLTTCSMCVKHFPKAL